MKNKGKLFFAFISFFIYILLFLVCMIAYRIITKDKGFELIINNWVITAIISVLVIIVIYFVASIIYKKGILRLQNDSVYVRNTPINFPVALAAILVGEDLEVKDFLKATIASLVAQGYLEIDENNQIIKCLDKDIKDLTEHEKYIYSCIEKGYYINKNEYSNLVMNDIEKLELLHEGISTVDIQKRVLIAGVVAIFVIIFDFFLRKKITILFLSAMSLFAMWVVFQVSLYQRKKYNRAVYHKTEKGELESYKFMGLKKFIMKFNFNVNKKVFPMNKFEKMIPYAIVFNEVSSMREYIDSTKYRMIVDESLRNFNVEE